MMKNILNYSVTSGRDKVEHVFSLADFHFPMPDLPCGQRVIGTDISGHGLYDKSKRSSQQICSSRFFWFPKYGQVFYPKKSKSFKQLLLDFLFGLHETLGTPVINMDAKSMTRDNYQTRMKMRENIVFSNTDSLIFAVDAASKETFLYELEVAQAIANHLVVAFDGEVRPGSDIMGWQSEKFFGTPFMLSKTSKVSFLGTAIQYNIRILSDHITGLFFSLRNVM